jgi:membrane-bound lytic murein transglycosylase D
MVAREGRSGGQKYYRLGPRFEKQLDQMVNQEFRAISGRKEDVPLELNQEVLINVNYFLNDARGFMTRSLNRGQKYIPIMKAILKQKGLPEDLVYLALIESGFRTEAVSHASAVGPWQFIAATGRRYGLTINEWVDERMDPIKSTYAAADYLIALYDMFNSWPLAIAAYNSGEGKIMKGMAKPEVDNYWDMAKADGFLAAETKRYVPSFLAAAIIAKDPLAYGLEVESSPVDVWDEVVVPEPIDLSMAAQLSGSSVERIKELNPHLKRLSTPPSELDFVLRVPVGASSSFYQLYAQLPEAQKSRRITIHVARRGETVDSVASRYNLTPEVVRQYNNLTSARLSNGQQLVLPASMAQIPDSQVPVQTAVARTSSRPAPRPGEVQAVRAVQAVETQPAARRTSEPRTPSAVSPPIMVPAVRAVTASASRNNRAPVIHSIRHRVRSGDTLGDLARLYGTSVDKLKADNRLASSSIQEGQVLLVNSNLPLTPATLPKTRTTWVEETEGVPVYHTVQSGETVSTIAARYNITQEQLNNHNNLTGSRIRTGQRLLIGTGPAEADPRTASSTYSVRSGDTLSTVAERHRLTIAQLRNLNSLSDDVIRPGQILTVSAERPQAPAVRTAGQRVYEVRSGDTVSTIAERHNMTTAELRALNNLKGDRIVQGQKLKVAQTQAPVQIAQAGRTSSSANRVYTVVPGDTVSTVAERHNLSSALLRELNNLESDIIRSGQTLILTSESVSPAPKVTAASSESRIYEVAAGDTVSTIAERHSMTSAQLRDLNSLKNDHIRSGQKLKVTGSPDARPDVRTAVQTNSQTPQVRTAQAQSSGQSDGFYEVVPGDTVSTIAYRFGLSSDELKELNNLSGNQIRSGQKLKIKSQAASSPGPDSPVQAIAVQSSPQAGSGQTGMHEVVPGDTVSTIAERYGMKSADLRALNGLSGDNIRIGQKLKVAGSAASSVQAPSSQTRGQNDLVQTGTYEVMPGDTVSTIAERHGIKSADLRALNGLSGDSIRIGQKLKVAGVPADQAARPQASSSSRGGQETYTVESGDSLESVAAFFKTTPAELRRINGLKSDSLSAGQVLNVRTAAGSVRQSAQTGGGPAGTYQVQAGDTMYSIARVNGISVDELKRLNNKNDNNIQPGQSLKVK